MPSFLSKLLQGAVSRLPMQSDSCFPHLHSDNALKKYDSTTLPDMSPQSAAELRNALPECGKRLLPGQDMDNLSSTEELNRGAHNDGNDG